MQKPKKVALKVITIATYLVFAFYIVWFALTGALNKFDDTAGYGYFVNGVGSFATKHIGAFQQVFSFALPSGVLWSIIVLLVIVVIAAAIIFAVKTGIKYKRLICANGMVAIYLMFIPAVFTAGGFHVYKDAIGKNGVYASSEGLLPVSCWILLIAAAVYCILAILLFFWCRRDAKKYPGEEPEKAVEDHIVEQIADAIDEEDIIDMNKDELLALIRQVVREELDRREDQPKVVQYFNGVGPYVPGQAPAPAPVVAPAPAPVAAPVEDPKAPAAARIPFAERIVKADKDVQEAYNEIKNELVSYGAHSRVSVSGDTFRLHRKTYAKIVMAGKSIKIYFALDPKDYADSPIPHSDASEKVMYEEIPFVFKVKSDLSRKRAKMLVADAMAKDGVEQGQVENVNYVKELRAELKAAKK